mgnify:CR=1 FL=1|jgi:hypothetical protein
MVSLGGLDVAFGSSLQLVRTNVLVVETDGTTTKAMAEQVHSVASRKYPSALRPDFTAFIADGAVTEGYATVLTDQVEGNILKDITAVPMAGSQYDATDANNRGMVWEGILNVGMAQINANDTMTADDLFTDASPAGIETDEMQGFPHLLQAQLMAAQFASDLTTLAGNHGVRTLSLAPLLTDSAIGGGTVVSTGVDAITESSTAAELNDGLAGAAAIVSILAIGRIA